MKNPWAAKGAGGGGQKGQYSFGHGGKGPSQQQQWPSSYNNQQYNKGWGQSQQQSQTPWSKGAVRPPQAKGSWKGKGPMDIHQLMESVPHNHEDDEKQQEEPGGDGEEQMWAMWSLTECTEEEAVPNLTDSSDDEEFQKVQKKKKKVQRKKSAHVCANRFAALALLEEDEEEEQPIMMHEEAKEEYVGYVKVTATVDSGSAEHALPSKSFDKVPTTKGPKFGRKYLTADGGKIANEGEKVLKMQTATGMPIGVRWQMTKVVKPLLSVRKLSAGGNTVILEEKNPRIIDRNGYVTPLRCQGGVFVVDLWVKSECGELFTRQ